MLLTVFYITATWMQTWKMGSIKRKLFQYISKQNGILLYRKIPCEEEEKDKPFEFCCGTSGDKQLDMLWEDLTWCTTSITPKQIISLDNWISFPQEDTSFPIPSGRVPILLDDERLIVLIEAAFVDHIYTSRSLYNIKKLGIPIAWKSAKNFGLILETDLNYLSQMHLNFMTDELYLDEGLQVLTINTVDIRGKPCIMRNTNLLSAAKAPLTSVSLDTPNDRQSGWPMRLPGLMSHSQWLTHVETIRSFSQSADGITNNEPVVVPGYPTVCLVSDHKVVPPTKINIELSEVDEPTEVADTTDKSESSDEPIQSIAVTPEMKEILRGASPRDFFPATEEVRSPSGRSTPGVISGSAGGSVASTPARNISGLRKNTFASISSLGHYPSVSTTSLRSVSSARFKPPNVLVYSESPLTTENIKSVLSTILHSHKYTIYSVTKEQLRSSTWGVNCSLLVICGNISETVEPVLVSYLLAGGRLFCLCSSFLHTLLPTFRTAEVRERELVRFTYAKWNRVRLMHHVFCYQNSPVKTKFSREADEPPSEKDRVSPVPVMPATVQVMDHQGAAHTLHVQVLGKEETWQTPSLLLAYFPSPAGRVVFSQVHLELDPSEILEERDGEALRSSDSARREIIRDILGTHLGLECGSGEDGTIKYSPAYFLGRHEIKMAFLEKVRGCEKLGNLKVKFCSKSDPQPPASSTFLPILVHACPHDFSTLEYYETLRTDSLGRLLIYCDVMSSSMELIDGELAHGITVVPSQQTSGRGRGGNRWLSPPGCAMFSQQLHFPIDSYLGSHPSILQHAVAVAVVSALSDISPDYAQALDLRLKWPNDIYVGDTVKIGGILSTCTFSQSTVVCNIGCGINLNNSSPTTCINSQIDEYNRVCQKKLPKLSREKVLALTFSKLEELLTQMQDGDISYLHDLYYSYWLHGDAQVSVVGDAGEQPVVICGIDEWGYLRVREQTGRIFSVQPDGNSFDMMEGLIMPK